MLSTRGMSPPGFTATHLGWRWKWGGGRAFNGSGNRGVVLTYREGKTVLIGFQLSDELTAAIEALCEASGSDC